MKKANVTKKTIFSKIWSRKYLLKNCSLKIMEKMNQCLTTQSPEEAEGDGMKRRCRYRGERRKEDKEEE